MLGERPTLELALGTNRGPEGPSIVQGSPAEYNIVKLIEVDPALSNRPKYVCTASELYWGPRVYKKKANAYTGCHMTIVSPLCWKDPGQIVPFAWERRSRLRGIGHGAVASSQDSSANQCWFLQSAATDRTLCFCAWIRLITCGIRAIGGKA